MTASPSGVMVGSSAVAGICPAAAGGGKGEGTVRMGGGDWEGLRGVGGALSSLWGGLTGFEEADGKIERGSRI